MVFVAIPLIFDEDCYYLIVYPFGCSVAVAFPLTFDEDCYYSIVYPSFRCSVAVVAVVTAAAMWMAAVAAEMS
jgi:hypothetical protein